MKSATDIHMTELYVPAQKDECDSLSILFWGYIITCPCSDILYLALQTLFVIIIEWCMFPHGLHQTYICLTQPKADTESIVMTPIAHMPVL